MRRTDLRRLGPCIALTVAAHAVLLALPVRPAAAASAPAPLTPVALQTRAIQRVAPGAPAATQALAAEAATALPEVVTLVEPLAKAVPSGQDQSATPERRAPTQEAVPDTASWSLPGIDDEDDAYLVRSLLAIAPAPLAPALIEFPPLAGAAERYRGELTLFIDEHGVVVRVRAEGEPLPAVLEDAARQAFMNVRFRPGELAEQGAVKSRIRIEVVFEAGVQLLIG